MKLVEFSLYSRVTCWTIYMRDAIAFGSFSWPKFFREGMSTLLPRGDGYTWLLVFWKFNAGGGITALHIILFPNLSAFSIVFAILIMPSAPTSGLETLSSAEANLESSAVWGEASTELVWEGALGRPVLGAELLLAFLSADLECSLLNLSHIQVVLFFRL